MAKKKKAKARKSGGFLSQEELDELRPSPSTQKLLDKRAEREKKAKADARKKRAAEKAAAAKAPKRPTLFEALGIPKSKKRKKK